MFFSRSWELLGQAKVCLKVPTQDEIFRIHRLARDNGLVTYLVVSVNDHLGVWGEGGGREARKQPFFSYFQNCLSISPHVMDHSSTVLWQLQLRLYRLLLSSTQHLTSCSLSLMHL